MTTERIVILVVVWLDNLSVFKAVDIMSDSVSNRL